jgi:hypothetical protein
MFGHRFFGGRFFGGRYFGDGGDGEPVVANVTRGGYPTEYIAQKRKPQKSSDEERGEVRALLRKALLGEELEAPAAEVVAIAKPHARKPRAGASVKVDWQALDTHLGELRAALAAYRASLADEDEDEIIMLAMVV